MRIYTFNPEMIETRDQIHPRHNNWKAIFEYETKEDHLHGAEGDRKSLITLGIRLHVRYTQNADHRE